MKRIFGSCAFVFVLLAAAAINANADQIYKWLMPDGTVLYSDLPVTKGKLEETLRVPPPDSKEIEEAQLAKLKRQAAQANRIAESRVTALDKAYAEIGAASQALEASKIELHVGLQPRAGEHLGTVSGHARLTDEYWRRVRELKRAVDEAQERLNEAYAARNALK